MQKITSNKTTLSVIFLVCLFVVFFSWLTFNKFGHNMWCGYDQGAYCQMLWTTMHGKLFWCSLSGESGLCDLAIHMNLLMFLLMPIYMLFKFPVTPSLVQVLYLGAAAFPVYLLAKERINNRAGLLFAIFYLTNNFTVQGIIEGFQPRNIALPLSFFGFYFLARRRYFWVCFFMFLLALSQETNSTILIMFGIYMVFVHKKRLLGAAISLFGIIWFTLSIKVFQPYFGNSAPLGALHFIASGKTVVSPAEIILYCFLHPIEILKRAFSYSKLDYLLRLFAPLGFLSLFSPKELFIGLSVILQNFVLSEHLISIANPRHTLPLMPFVFISAIYSAGFLFKKLKSRWVFVEIFIVVCWAISTYKFVWDPGYNPRFLQAIAPLTKEEKIHREALRRITNLVPRNASICGDLKAFPFLANRFTFYDMPLHIEETEYVLIDAKDPNFSAKPIKSREEYFEIMNSALRSPDFEIVGAEDQIFLLKRKK